MKKLFLSLVAVFALVTINAQIISPNIQTYGTASYSLVLTNGFNLISTTPLEIQQIQLVAGGTNVVVAFYDNQYGHQTWTNGAYSAVTIGTSTNLYINSTNAQGIISTNGPYTGSWRTTSTVGAGNVTQTATATAAAPANGIATVNGRFDFGKGVTVLLTPTNTAATLNILYRRLY
jgi:hypothetical protein